VEPIPMVRHKQFIKEKFGGKKKKSENKANASTIYIEHVKSGSGKPN
jgi:hypothetical protein